MPLYKLLGWLNAVACGVLLLVLHVQGESHSVSNEEQVRAAQFLGVSRFVCGREVTREGKAGKDGR